MGRPGNVAPFNLCHYKLFERDEEREREHLSASSHKQDLKDWTGWFNSSTHIISLAVFAFLRPAGVSVQVVEVRRAT